ncbi:MAG: glycine cleavage system protein GcvH [Actinomycetes bacterium]
MEPEDLKYTAEHEWARVPAATPEGQPVTVRVGITDHAQQALGDIVFVSLPKVGAAVQAGQPCGEVESTKSVSDVYAPVSGVVRARNETLDSNPELVNASPYDQGWLFDLDVSDPGELSVLLGPEEYRATLG